MLPFFLCGKRLDGSATPHNPFWLPSNLSQVLYICSQNPIGTQPSTGEAAEKGFALFEAKPSLQSPGSIEERRASRLRRDKGHRVPFLWFVSLGKQRNEQRRLPGDQIALCLLGGDQILRRRLPVFEAIQDGINGRMAVHPFEPPVLGLDHHNGA